MDFKSILRSAVSGLALARAMVTPTVRKERHLTTTRKAGKRGQPFRRIIASRREGPFFSQVGWAPDGRPLMRTYYETHVLHATKGWRVYRNPLPGIQALRRAAA